MRGKLFQQDLERGKDGGSAIRSVTMRLCRLGTSALAKISGDQENVAGFWARAGFGKAYHLEIDWLSEGFSD